LKIVAAITHKLPQNLLRVRVHYDVCLQDLKTLIAGDEVKVKEVKSSDKKCQAVVENPSADQDVQFYDPICNKLYEDWNALMRDVSATLAQLQNALPQAEKRTNGLRGYFFMAFVKWGFLST